MNVFKNIISIAKDWTLPLAITFGTVAYLIFYFVPALDEAGDFLYKVFNIVLPVGLFFILFFSYCKVDFRQIRLARWHFYILGVQLLLTLSMALLALACGEAHPTARLIFEALLTCVIAPCATAAPIVTQKIGGNLNSITAFMLFSGLIASFTIPALFSLLEEKSQLAFLPCFLTIIQKVGLITLFSMFCAWAVRHVWPSLHAAILRRRNIAYYSWSFCLTITTGIMVKNMVFCMSTPGLLIVIALLSLLICVFQFLLGRIIGRRFGVSLDAGQAMFQKNTGLAIWVANIYLSPISTVGAGSYVVWQNLINSYELWQSRRRGNDT